MALRRRALAFDLIGVATFNTINKYHQALAQRLQEPPPPGYSKVSLQQLIRADRAVFLRASELTATLKRSAGGQLPLDSILSTILLDPSVAYHLLPLPLSSSSSAESAREGKRPGSDAGAMRGAKDPEIRQEARRSRSCQEDQFRSTQRAYVQASCIRPPKVTGFAGALICHVGAPMPKCARGLRLCAEPGCLKPHSLQQHS